MLFRSPGAYGSESGGSALESAWVEAEKEIGDEFVKVGKRVLSTLKKQWATFDREQLVKKVEILWVNNLRYGKMVEDLMEWKEAQIESEDFRKEEEKKVHGLREQVRELEAKLEEKEKVRAHLKEETVSRGREIATMRGAISKLKK